MDSIHDVFRESQPVMPHDGFIFTPLAGCSSNAVLLDVSDSPYVEIQWPSDEAPEVCKSAAVAAPSEIKSACPAKASTGVRMSLKSIEIDDNQAGKTLQSASMNKYSGLLAADDTDTQPEWTTRGDSYSQASSSSPPSRGPTPKSGCVDPNLKWSASIGQALNTGLVDPAPSSDCHESEHHGMSLSSASHMADRAHKASERSKKRESDSQKSPLDSQRSPLDSQKSPLARTLFPTYPYPKSRLKSTKMVTYGQDEDCKFPRQVINYKFDYLVEWGGFTGIPAKPSVFKLRKALLRQILFLVILCFLSYFGMTWFIKNVQNSAQQLGTANERLLRRLQDDGGGGDGDGDDEFGGDDDGGDGDDGTRAEIMSQVMGLLELAQYANGLVVFFLGVFIALSISRWWTLRSGCVFGIQNAQRTLAFTLSSVLPGEQWTKVRQQMSRHAMLSFRLLFLCCEGRVGEEQLRCLIDEGLLLEEEKDRLLLVQLKVKGPQAELDGAFTPVDLDLAEIPWAWICSGVHVLARKHAFAPPIMGVLHGCCNQARSAIDQISTQLNTQLPFAYTHLIVFIVHCSCCLSAVNGGILAALAGTNLAFACRLLFFIVLSGLYLGLLTISSVIADPFGDDVVDFPSLFIMQRLWKGSHTIDGKRYIPPGPFTPENQSGTKRASLNAIGSLNASPEFYESTPGSSSPTSAMESGQRRSLMSRILPSALKSDSTVSTSAASSTPKTVQSPFESILRTPITPQIRSPVASMPEIRSPGGVSLAPVCLTPNGSFWTPLRRDFVGDSMLRYVWGSSSWDCRVQVCVMILALGLAVVSLTAFGPLSIAQ